MKPACRILTLCLYVLLSMAATAHAQSYTFTTIFVPGSAATNTAGMNNAGDVVGNYDPAGGGTSHGYVYHQGAFSDIYFAGSHFTSPEGINSSGVIAGLYQSQNRYHGFVYSAGNYTSFDYPGATITELWGINNPGDVVGTADTAHGGFLYSNGVFTSIRYPGAIITQPMAINDAKQIVGYYGTSTGTHGFLESGGDYTTIDFPVDARDTILTGINNSGQIFGYYTDTVFLNHPFVYRNGMFHHLPVPNTSQAYFTGFNDSDQFVGYNQRATQIGFLATPN